MAYKAATSDFSDFIKHVDQDTNLAGDQLWIEVSTIAKP